MHVFQLYCNINNLVIPVIRNCLLGNMLTKGPKYKTFTTPVYWFKEQVETPTEELVNIILKNVHSNSLGPCQQQGDKIAQPSCNNANL
jgi:hypothetical protein